MQILYQWIFVHLVADFLLQSKELVEQKRCLKFRSPFLYLHCFLHSAGIYLFSPNKSLWLIPVIIFITHYFIDLWKLYQKNSLKSFITDQLLHGIVLVLLWGIFYKPDFFQPDRFIPLLNSNQVWLIATGYLFITFPLSFLLGYATEKWRKETEKDFNRSAVSLSEAGKWIGIFERLLVYTFVLTNHFEGIGFLIAAKSILRFPEIKGNSVRREAEYVLIGTLMSFASTLLIGLLITQLLQLYK